MSAGVIVSLCSSLFDRGAITCTRGTETKGDARGRARRPFISQKLTGDVMRSRTPKSRKQYVEHSRGVVGFVGRGRAEIGSSAGELLVDSL